MVLRKGPELGFLKPFPGAGSRIGNCGRSGLRSRAVRQRWRNWPDPFQPGWSDHNIAPPKTTMRVSPSLFGTADRHRLQLLATNHTGPEPSS